MLEAVAAGTTLDHSVRLHQRSLPGCPVVVAKETADAAKDCFYKGIFFHVDPPSVPVGLFRLQRVPAYLELGFQERPLETYQA